MAVISFDFDDCIYITVWERRGDKWYGTEQLNEKLVNKMRRYAEAGHEIVIVSYRSPKHENNEWIMQYMPSRVLIEEYVKKHELPVKKIYYTNHEPKGPLLKKIGCVLHFDDDLDAIYSAEEHGIRGIWIVSTHY